MPKRRAKKKAHPRPTAKPISRRLLFDMDGVGCEDAEELDMEDVFVVFGNRGEFIEIALLPGKGRCSHAWSKARKSKRTILAYHSRKGWPIGTYSWPKSLSLGL